MLRWLGHRTFRNKFKIIHIEFDRYDFESSLTYSKQYTTTITKLATPIKVLLIILSEIKTHNLHVHTNLNGLLSFFLYSFQSFNRNEKHSFSVSNGCHTSVEC